MALTYSSYLHLDELLSLQQPRSNPPEHDEYLFIVVHQTYELWFKLLLIELERIKAAFSGNRLWDAVHTFKRVRTILKTVVGQMDVLETMTPLSFTSFRDRLDTASGFQSVQFRELEFVLGYKRPQMLHYHPEQSPARQTLERRLQERSVVDHFYDFLVHQGADVPRHLLERDPREGTTADAELQEALVQLYQTRPELAVLFELMTDCDEGLQEWRYRHIKLVERSIGAKKGTGGSLGVEFLKKSLFLPVFPDLWAIRHRF
ncbi:MAG TPA: tryptophan 2,3-dioxygenase family protein [Burkholderiales bacterium]|nr:tryptophan 2,3-dioxygenase family protein [Burkholderiales bacterium]